MNPFEFVIKHSDKIQYTSIERVIEMIHRKYDFITHLNTSDIIEWVGDVYGLVNYPGMFRNKITGTDALTPNVEVSQYRGTLPVDFKSVLKAGVRDYDSKIVYRPSTGTFTEFRYALDTTPQYANTDKVYSIRGGYIFVEDEEVTLEIAYRAYPIDDRGFPLVPDNDQVLQYAMEYIAEKVAFNMLAAKKIDQYIYEKIEQRMHWRAGAAQASMVNRTSDEMETWTWSRLKLMPRILQHESSYSYFGNKEDLLLGTNTE